MSDAAAESISHLQAVPRVLLDAEDAAAALGMSRSHFLDLDKSGRLGPQSMPFGRSRRWALAELQRWADAGCPIRAEWLAMKQQRRATA